MENNEQTKDLFKNRVERRYKEMIEKELKFEVPEKPKIEDLNIKLDCSDFQEPNKAEALIKSLNLKAGDKIKEFSDGEKFIINSKVVLKGDAPEKYKQEIEKVKNILTKEEIKSISLYYRRKKENSKVRDKIYYGITKRIDKLYNWDNENKKHIPKKNSKKSIEICELLDWISENNYLNGFKNIIYHLLSKDERDFIYCYRQAWFNKPIPNIQEWIEENEGEYLVLTEDEANYRSEEYLTDDTYLLTSSVEAGRTTESLDDWAKSVIEIDGRGSVLSSYDGCEEQEKINGICYCIYRTN